MFARLLTVADHFVKAAEHLLKAVDHLFEDFHYEWDGFRKNGSAFKISVAGYFPRNQWKITENGVPVLSRHGTPALSNSEAIRYVRVLDEEAIGPVRAQIASFLQKAESWTPRPHNPLPEEIDPRPSREQADATLATIHYKGTADDSEPGVWG
ncbi:MAG: hypothetical protein P4M15_01295 [Alphaproteobacteria bacterium]|nr:hypothetical protein [Alphaproteobacteria bacterium]